jgi:hypothetical protein
MPELTFTDILDHQVRRQDALEKLLQTVRGYISTLRDAGREHAARELEGAIFQIDADREHADREQIDERMKAASPETRSAIFALIVGRIDGGPKDR